MTEKLLQTSQKQAKTANPGGTNFQTGSLVPLSSGKSVVIKTQKGLVYSVVDGVTAQSPNKPSGDALVYRRGKHLLVAYGDGTQLFFEDFFGWSDAASSSQLVLPPQASASANFVVDSAQPASLGQTWETLYASEGSGAWRPVDPWTPWGKELNGLGASAAAAPTATPAATGAGGSGMGGLLGGVAGLGALAVAGGKKSGSSEDAASPMAPITVGGSFAAGPALSNSGMLVKAYRVDTGELLGSTTLDSAGSYTLKLSYLGVVLLRVVDGNGSATADYMDERTNQATSLSADLRALVVLTTPGSRLAPETTANELLLLLLPALVSGLQRFCAQGFAAFASEFAQRDVLSGRELQLSNGVHGTGAGVDAEGVLWLQTPRGRVPVSSDEVSVRAAGAA